MNLPSLQTIVASPDTRTETEVDLELDEEFAFHLEHLARELIERGMTPDEALREARRRFGDVDLIKRRCRRIVLEERIMLQRINVVLMVIVLVALVAVGFQLWSSQRANSAMLGDINTQLAQLRMDAQPAERTATGSSTVFVTGGVRPGVYALPSSGELTLRRLIAAAGGISDEQLEVTVTSAGATTARARFDAADLIRDGGADIVLVPGDLISVKPRAGVDGEASLRRQLLEERSKVQALNGFVSEMLTSTDPVDARTQVDVGEVLDAAESRVNDLAESDPETAAAIRDLIERTRDEIASNDDAARGPKRAPFTAVRWADGKPEVRVEGTWYRLLVLDGLRIEQILAFCEQRFPHRVHKRFSEDLVQVMAEMGRTPGETVRLDLAPLGGGRSIIIEAPMTGANRDAVHKFNRDQRALPVAPPPVRREHSGVAKGYEHIAERNTAHHWMEVRVLTRAQAESDLDLLEAYMADRWSYLRMKDVDYQAALDTIRAGLGDDIPDADFALQIQRLIALIGDGHAGVSDLDDIMGGRHAQVLLADGAHGVVAFKPDRSELLDPTHPYVREIEGVPIDEWMDAAMRLVPDGSPQMRRDRALRLMRHIDQIARELGVDPPFPTVSYLLTNAEGTSEVIAMGHFWREKPRYGDWPRTASEIRDDGIGYLRLARMDGDAASHVRSMMPLMLDTKGLIIDVRGNGGGSREALLALAPFLMPPDTSPIVTNVAAYRLSEAFEDDHLAARFMYRADDGHWNDAQRAAIKAFAPAFEPEWTLPEGEFSEWHYLVLDRPADTPHYEGPVVVLMDVGCFSATDIFLGAIDVIPDVTLMGTPSGGGSGRARTIDLPESRLEVRLSSMASFRPDGRLYDGRGVEPDVVVHPTPTCFVGKTDVQLDAALQRLKSE